MSEQNTGSMLSEARARLAVIAAEEGLLDVAITVTARPLTPAEAIGTPSRRDYPILVGKERVVEACVLGRRGHAFTDSPRDFGGSLADVLALPLDSSGNRAVMVATLNAVLGYLGRIEGTVHCKDEDPEKCAGHIAQRLLAERGRVSVGLIGLNPAIADQLVRVFDADHVRISDLCQENLGKRQDGSEVEDGRQCNEQIIAASDFVLVTGTTLVNDTFDEIFALIRTHGKGYWVYGVTAAGVSSLLGLDRICPYGRDG
jgi:hypothetical protein